MLAEAKSNRREEGTGADVFDRVVRDGVTVAARSRGRRGRRRRRAERERRLGRHAAGGRDADHDERYDEGASEGPSEGQSEGKNSADVAGDSRAVNLRPGASKSIAHDRGRASGALSATVGRERLTMAELDAETKAALVMAELPGLLSQAADSATLALVVDAARELRPDGETPEGVGRRAALAPDGAGGAGRNTVGRGAARGDRVGGDRRTA